MKESGVIASQSDLDPKDRAMPEMLSWCKQQGGIVVMKSGLVLTVNPSSRLVQNCKIVMSNKGVQTSRVATASEPLIQTIIANAESHSSKRKNEPVSIQQQRLRNLIREAIDAEASDIHIEVRADIAKIRFRKHGEMYLHAEWQPKLGREIASVAFNKETDHATSHFNPMIPQNASMPLHIDGKDVRLRLASLPAHTGFDMVLRVLATGDKQVATLSDLGYTDDQVKLLEKVSMLPGGAVLVAGPTGSGKTTTLAACMTMVGSDRKVYTIEDPIEKVVDSISQVPVNTDQSDRTFASMGRAALRMDPDIIVLGEMRDEDTAAVMVRASITGHLVFSTIHTNSAPGIITRLVDMGISPTMLSDPNVLACLVCQRLVPTLCNSCARPVTESEQHQADLARLEKVLGDLSNVRVRGKHCHVCNSSGILGRTVVAEIIKVDEAGREFIQKCDILGWEKDLKKNGWLSARDHAKQLTKQGICDPFDAERVLGEMQ